MEDPSQDAFEQKLSRYIVGIDLGTTNCAVAYLDSEKPDRGIRAFPVLQWVDFGTLEQRELLPSFVYQPLDAELGRIQSTGSSETASHAVGCLARDRGLQLPGRQIASAKSWLCHEGVDRDGPILPWQSDEGVEKMSPVDASARYLRQIRDTWNQTFRSHPLEEQDIVLTLPASFDQVARQLTIEAASRAGLKRVLPIEEPQAAFYAWLAKHKDDWEAKVKPGQTILVCDIGGGTTDFTLIRVREASPASAPNTDLDRHLDEEQADSVSIHEPQAEANHARLSLHRVAVGQHLILGGDNIDLALAKFAEHKLSPVVALPARAWDALRQACRVAKETLLGGSAPPSHTIHLPGAGSRLVGGGQRVEITSEEIDACVLDGFFPRCKLFDRPESQQTGFQDFGLPFATDAAITKHLAAFLWAHRKDGRSEEELCGMSETESAKPDYILFNGGVMASSRLRERLVEVVANWFAESETVAGWQPEILEGERLDLAVAVGAAYFGQVRRGDGVAIEAKLACSYYLQTEQNPPRGLCIVPGSASPGDTFQLSDQPFELAIGQPVQFPLSYSSTRLADRVGEVVEFNAENFTALPPIRTVLELARTRQQKMIRVFVEVELTQIGTLQIYCQAVDSEHRWKLEFDVRGSTQTDLSSIESVGAHAGTLDERTVAQAAGVIADVFSSAGNLKPSELMNRLAQALEMRRNEWPPGLLRAIWAELIERQDGRRKSAAHEARWLNLLGYSLRPGYGLAADDWRVAQTWRAVHGKLAFPAASSRNESLILWRRIAGGFTAGQQLTVFQQIAGPLRSVLDPQRRAKGGGGTAPHELIELLRLVGALELLPNSEKALLGNWLVDLLNVKKWVPCQAAVLWAIGRLGARVPVYGPLNCVVDVEVVTRWLGLLCQLDSSEPGVALALMLCCRRVNDRYRDVSEDVRETVLTRLADFDGLQHYQLLVREGGKLESEEANQILGESLPLGLKLA